MMNKLFIILLALCLQFNGMNCLAQSTKSKAKTTAVTKKNTTTATKKSTAKTTNIRIYFIA